MKITKLEKGRKGQKGRGSKFDISLRRKIAREYIEGDLSTTQLAEIYNVPFQRISEWAKQFSNELADQTAIPPMTLEEQKELDGLKKQNEVLKQKLEYEQMRNFALETLVDLAKTELGIDLRKNSGAKQPKE